MIDNILSLHVFFRLYFESLFQVKIEGYYLLPPTSPYDERPKCPWTISVTTCNKFGLSYFNFVVYRCGGMWFVICFFSSFSSNASMILFCWF